MNRWAARLPAAVLAAFLLPACGSGDFNPALKFLDVETVPRAPDTYTSNPGGGDDRLLAGAQDVTSIYLVGTETFGPGTAAASEGWRIEKRNSSDGVHAAGFDGDGVVRHDPTPFDDRPRAIGLYWDLYVVGHEGGSAGSRWRIERRSFINGALQPFFGTSGVVRPDLPGGNHSAAAVAVDGTWLYVVGAHDMGTGNGRWRIEKRLMADGSFDPAFPGGGRDFADPSPGDDEAVAVAMDATAIYILGTDANGGNPRWRVQKRYRSSGLPVPTFGTGGEIVIDPSPGVDVPAALQVGDGKLFVAGTRDIGGDARWHLEARRASSGNQDPGFPPFSCCAAPGGDGVSGLFAGLGYETVHLSGWTRTAAGDRIWRVEERSRTDGTLVRSFETDPTGNLDAPGRFLSAAWGYVLAGGWEETATPGDFRWKVMRWWE